VNRYIFYDVLNDITRNNSFFKRPLNGVNLMKSTGVSEQKERNNQLIR